MSAADPVPPPAGGSRPHAADPTGPTDPSVRPDPTAPAVTSEPPAASALSDRSAATPHSDRTPHFDPATLPDPSAPPALPPVRADLAHIVVPVTALWFVAFVVLLFFLDDLRAHQAMVWLWTCLAGGLLGLIGLAVYGWQRRAARQGRRSANAMVLQERW